MASEPTDIAKLIPAINFFMILTLFVIRNFRSRATVATLVLIFFAAAIQQVPYTAFKPECAPFLKR